MSGVDNGGEVIRYTTKEILAEIRGGLSDIKHEQTELGRRVEALERAENENEEVREIVKRLDVRSQVEGALEDRKDRGFTVLEKTVAGLCGVALVALNGISLIHSFF